MLFKEFLYHHADGIGLMLPGDVISGDIEDVIYKSNPIVILIKDKQGKKTKALFHNRHTYDLYVGKQKPEKGKQIQVSLNHNGAIKYIKIGSNQK